MNRNEPSGTHVLNPGGGEEGTDAGVGRVCPLEIGSGTSGNVGPAILFACTIGRLKQISHAQNEYATHSSSFISIVVGSGETDLAFDNLNPPSLAGKLWLFG